MLWNTHGSPGAIYFRNSALSTAELTTDFAAKGYEKLFPKPTKTYFSGPRKVVWPAPLLGSTE